MKLDADERELLNSVERGEWKSARGGKRERARYSRYAKAVASGRSRPSARSVHGRFSLERSVLVSEAESPAKSPHAWIGLEHGKLWVGEIDADTGILFSGHAFERSKA